MKKIVIIILLSLTIPGPKIKSLFLPGWGELSKGDKARAKMFLYTESILVIGAYSFNKLSSNYKTDYIAYAKTYANVELNDKDYMFALDVGNNNNTEDFNDIKERQRSLIMDLDSKGYVVREYGHEIYPEGVEYNWDWDSDLNRENYNSMRIKSINYEKYASFALAGMIINRIISVIDVILLGHEDSNVSSIVVPKGYDGLELQLHIKF